MIIVVWYHATQENKAFLEAQNKALTEKLKLFEQRAVLSNSKVDELSSKTASLEVKEVVILEPLQKEGIKKEWHGKTGKLKH